MPPQLVAALKRAGTQVNGMTLGQKVIAVIGIGVLLLGGSAFYAWASEPDYVTAFPGLSAEDAGAVRDALVAVNIPAELDGTSVTVPADQADEALVEAAKVGLPKGKTSGSAMLASMGVTSTQFQQKAAYQAALEERIGSTLGMLDGVQTASVQLAVPEKTVFEDQKQPTTAAVVVDTGTHQATTDEVNAMVSLVSSSVPDLMPADVTITDATGKLLTDDATGASGKREELTTGYEQKIQTEIQSVLDQALGAGKAITTVNATLNMDATNRASTTYTPSGAPANSETKESEKYTGAGSGAGGALGYNGVFGPDGTGVETGATGDGSAYTKDKSTTDNANNVVVDNTVVAPGDVERQSVAVVVDQKALEAFGGQQNLQTLLTTAVGFDENRGDVVSVTPATFDTTAKDAAAAALEAAAAEQKSQEQFALIKQGAIALGVLILALVLFIAWRRAVKKGRREAVDIGELERLYPEVPVAAGQAGLALPTASDAHLLTAPEPEPEALRRQEFGQLVDTQPAEVANLLRGWLAASKKG